MSTMAAPVAAARPRLSARVEIIRSTAARVTPRGSACQGVHGVGAHRRSWRLRGHPRAMCQAAACARRAGRAIHSLAWLPIAPRLCRFPFAPREHACRPGTQFLLHMRAFDPHGAEHNHASREDSARYRFCRHRANRSGSGPIQPSRSSPEIPRLINIMPTGQCGVIRHELQPGSPPGSGSGVRGCRGCRAHRGRSS